MDNRNNHQSRRGGKSTIMKYQNLIKSLPYSYPFLFVDALEHIDELSVKGTYTFRENLPFYQGHFIGNPITPGVILTECCAQIGLVCMGLHILDKTNALNNNVSLNIVFSSSEMEFYKPVHPNETVTVYSEKVYFRFHKLKCKVKMYNAAKELVCKGILAGMIIPTPE